MTESTASNLTTGGESIYEPITKSTNIIRILDVLPSASIGAELQTRLRTVRLDDTDVHYDALSWCWGDSNNQTEIVVNGQRLFCRNNLASALRHLRCNDSLLTIWADALCINQSNLEEKSQQIRIMGDIYRRADSLRIWLGDSDEHSSEGMSVLQKWLDGAGISLGDFDPTGTRLTEFQVRAFCSILNRPWWSRVWMIQEFALCKSRVLHCGPAYFVLRSVPELKVIMGRHYEVFGRPQYRKRLDTEHDISEAVDRFHRLVSLAEDHQTIKERYKRDFAITVIISANGCDATEERDKIYGCLALLSGIAPYIPVNYSLSMDELYAAVSYALLKRNGTFIWCFLRKGCAISDRPSWICDFSAKLDKRNQAYYYLARAVWVTAPAALKIERDLGRLRVMGANFDVIVSCQSALASYENDPVDWKFFDWTHEQILQKRWRTFFQLPLTKESQSAYVGGGAWEDAYWRTLVRGVIRGKDFYQIRAADVGPIKRWLRAESTSDEDRQRAWVFVNSMAEAMTARDSFLFTTSRGYIGQSAGSRDVKVGDGVYFLLDSQMPWILRPADTTDGSQAFKIVCECYVHGIMDAEKFYLPVAGYPELKAWKRHDLRKRLFGGQDLELYQVTKYGDIVLV